MARQHRRQRVQMPWPKGTNQHPLKEASSRVLLGSAALSAVGTYVSAPRLPEPRVGGAGETSLAVIRLDPEDMLLLKPWGWLATGDPNNAAFTMQGWGLADDVDPLDNDDLSSGDYLFACTCTVGDLALPAPQYRNTGTYKAVDTVQVTADYTINPGIRFFGGPKPLVAGDPAGGADTWLGFGFDCIGYGTIVLEFRATTANLGMGCRYRQI